MNKLETSSARQDAEHRIALVIKQLTQKFIGKPGDLSVRVESLDGSFALTLAPHPEDNGKVIGADGVMDKALRVVVTVLAKREGFDTATFVVRDGDQRPTIRERNHQPDAANWPAAWIATLFESLCFQLLAKPYSWRWHHKDWKSTLMLSIAANEARHVTDAELGEALSRIFGAIGRCHGRKVFVNLERRAA